MNARIDSGKNNAQKSREDKKFRDSRSITEKRKTSGGGEVDVTTYSDGSSTVNFGGLGGSIDYDEFGREC
jgi:hypothetical protein